MCVYSSAFKVWGIFMIYLINNDVEIPVHWVYCMVNQTEAM